MVPLPFTRAKAYFVIAQLLAAVILLIGALYGSWRYTALVPILPMMFLAALRVRRAHGLAGRFGWIGWILFWIGLVFVCNYLRRDEWILRSVLQNVVFLIAAGAAAIVAWIVRGFSSSTGRTEVAPTRAEWESVFIPQTLLGAIFCGIGLYQGGETLTGILLLGPLLTLGMLFGNLSRLPAAVQRWKFLPAHAAVWGVVFGLSALMYRERMTDILIVGPIFYLPILLLFTIGILAFRKGWLKTGLPGWLERLKIRSRSS